jgi:hypothetical protein
MRTEAVSDYLQLNDSPYDICMTYTVLTMLTVPLFLIDERVEHILGPSITVYKHGTVAHEAGLNSCDLF